jgi:hypothetical protein
MIKCATCPTSLQRVCNTCPVRDAKEIVKVLDDESQKHFDSLLKRFDGAWRKMSL